MTQSSDIVLAGSKPFLAALLAPLTQRVGVRPRVAGDPQQARTLCQNPVRLLVFEYQGEQWLPLCRELTQSTSGVPVIVAALSPEQTEAQSMLAAAGVGQSPIWSGNAEHFLNVVDRALASGVVAATKGPPILVRQPPGGPSAAEPSAFSLPPAGRSISEPGSAEPLSIDTHPVEAQPAVPAALVSSEIWPGTVLPAEDAEFLLVSAAGGSLPRAPVLRQVTQKVVGGLTNLDRAALKGEPTPIDPSVLRRASVLRWQVAAAVATTPAARSQVDSAAVAALLAGIDGVLADFQKAGEGVPPDDLAMLDQLRGTLVKDAIDFTDAVHRITPDQVIPDAVVTVRPTPVKAVRVLSNRGAEEAKESKTRPANRGWVIVLVLSIAGAGTFHGYRWITKPTARPPSTLPGAPTGTTGVTRGTVRLLVMQAGKQVDPTELERFKAQEQSKGNIVREIASGTWVIESAGPAEGEAKP